MFVLRGSKDRGMLCVFYIYRGRRRGIRHQVTFPKGREGVLEEGCASVSSVLSTLVSSTRNRKCKHLFVAKIDMQNLNKCSFEDFRKVLLHYEL